MSTPARTSDAAPDGASTASPALSEESVASRDDPSPRYVLYVIGLLTVLNAFNYMDRMALSVLMPMIKVDLSLSDGQLGLLVGFAFSLFYAICGIPIARWADRGIRRDIIALSLATWSVMTAVSGAAQNFWHLFVARIGVGAGEAGGLPPAQSLLYDYVPSKRRSSIFALHGLGLYIGMILAMSLAGWLGEIVGWRWTFVLIGLPGLLLAVIVKLTLREPFRGRLDDVRDAHVDLPLRKVVRLLWCNDLYSLIVCFGIVNGFVQYGLLQWWPSFFSRVFGLSMSAVGSSLAVAVGAGSIAGLLGGGFLADRTAGRSASGPLTMGVAAVCAALPLFWAALFAPSAAVSLILVSLGNLLLCAANAPITAVLLSTVAPQLRATASAVNTFVISSIGFGLGPFCVGLLSDGLTPFFGAQALRYALLAPVAFIPIMAVFLYLASRNAASQVAAR
jgi:predicted MFS family arabinose efflux permease